MGFLTFIAQQSSGKICTNPFYNDINFQRKDELTEQSILQHFRHAYESNIWPNFWAFEGKRFGPIPLQIKKVQRSVESRSIISYFHQPLKKVFFVAATGLMTCL